MAMALQPSLNAIHVYVNDGRRKKGEHLAQDESADNRHNHQHPGAIAGAARVGDQARKQERVGSQQQQTANKAGRLSRDGENKI